jgi:acyl-CoA synthetase (AMP-forming)/AMP-acid ligase II
MTTATTLRQLLDAGPAGKPAIVVPDGVSITYAQLADQVDQVSEFLAQHGCAGANVAMSLPNTPEAIVAFLATAQVATALPLNPTSTRAEFEPFLAEQRTKALMVRPGEGEPARQAAPSGLQIIEIGIDASGLHLSSNQPSAGGSGHTAAAEDVALQLSSSGTTGRPKRVPLRHRNMLASVDHIVEHYNLNGEDRTLCVMPLFHIHGLVAATLSTLASGGTIVLPDKFNPLGFERLLRGQAITWYTAVPTIHQLAMRRKDPGSRAEVDTLRFIRSCSSKLPLETYEQLEGYFGVPVLEAYGMTEASHQMASNPLPPRHRVPGSVGPGTGVQIGIMNEAGDLLPGGTPGEVVIQGPNVIDHYDNNPEADATSFVRGWFRTGDQGVLDQDGYLTLVGRLKEMINRGGEKIAPLEVDEVLLTHPAVAEAVAFGMPHPTWGEEVAAAVVLSGEASEKDLIAHARQRLADYKSPRKIFIVEQIPRTPVGKVQRLAVAKALLPS